MRPLQLSRHQEGGSSQRGVASSQRLFPAVRDCRVTGKNMIVGDPGGGMKTSQLLMMIQM